MKTEFLSAWEMAALEMALNYCLQNSAGLVHGGQGQALAEKLERASHVRLSFGGSQS